MPTSLIPPGCTRLPRFVLYPYGPRTSPSFTLAMYGAGYDVVMYRLTMCLEHGKASKPLFSGTIKPPAGFDPVQVASDIIKAIAVAPGDATGEDSGELSPEQLGMLVMHGQALRAEAARRFGWSPAESRPLRADLPVTYSHRAAAGGKREHVARCGEATGHGTSKREAQASLRAAAVNHLSAIPVFKSNPALKVVYAIYPHGGSWEAQEINPERPDGLGQKYHLVAKSHSEAKFAVDSLIIGKKRTVRVQSGLFARVQTVREAVG